MKKQLNNPAPSIAERTFCRALSNGLKIYVFPRPGSGTVFLQTVVRTGSLHEGEFLGCGLSHFLEHMAFSGTETHPGHTAIADRVNQLGGVLNACTSYERTQYYMELPAGTEKEAVDMLYGMIALPLFPEERFQNEKGAILRECSMYQDKPASVLFEHLAAESFQYHPARVPIIGYQSKIGTVDREMMRAYWQRRYSPCRTAFVVAGDVDAETIADYIEAKTQDWSLGRVDEPILTPEPVQTHLRRLETEFNDPLAFVALGFHEPSRNDPDFIANDLFSKILTGSDSARLVRELKLKRNLVDEIISGQSLFPDISLGYVVATAAPEKTEDAISAMHRVIDDLKTKPVKKIELDRIARGVERGYWEVLRKNQGIANLLTQCFVNRRSLGELDGYIDEVRSVTPDDIMRVAQKYHCRENETIVRQMSAESRKKKTFSAPAGTDKGKPELIRSKHGPKMLIGTCDELPLVEFTLNFPAGTMYEPKELAGISDLANAVYGCATQDYSEEELNRILDDNAIYFNTDIKADCFIIRGSCLKEQIPTLIPLMKSVLAKPVYPVDILERERETLIRDLECDETDPNEKATELVRGILFGDNHPAGYSNRTICEKTETLGRKDIADFCSRMFDPAQTVVSAAGAISRAEAEKYLSELLDAIPWTDDPLKPVDGLPRRKPGIRTCSAAVDRQQAVVMDAFRTPASGDFNAAMRMALFASSGMSSRLFKQVREERGLAYYTGIAPTLSRFHGWAAYFAGTHPGAEAEVLKLFEEERKLRSTEGFTEDEFEAARALMTFSINCTMQDTLRLVAESARKELIGEGAHYFWRRLAELKKMTPADLNAGAKQLFSASFRVMAVVSPEKFSDFPDIPD